MAGKRLQGTRCKEDWCPIEVALEVVGGMWKIVIIRELLAGTRRYSELHRELSPITHKMLAQQLRQLETDGVVQRVVYPQVPPKVEYSLTTLGRSVGPVLEEMAAFGTRAIKHRRKHSD